MIKSSETVCEFNHFNYFYKKACCRYALGIVKRSRIGQCRRSELEGYFDDTFKILKKREGRVDVKSTCNN
jgi:hypothetical protein